MNIHKSFWLSLLIFLIVVSVGSGCGKKEEEKLPVPGAHKRVARKVELAKPVTSATRKKSVYVYDMFRSRDPFQPYISARRVKLNTGPIVHPLQKYDLSSLSLKGIVWGISSPTALIETPDGKGYSVRVGTPIGKNGGKVWKILPDKVIILEKYVDYKGEIKTRKVYLKLPEKEEGVTP